MLIQCCVTNLLLCCGNKLTYLLTIYIMHVKRERQTETESKLFAKIRVKSMLYECMLRHMNCMRACRLNNQP